jgi:lysophospholipase L1-like esterase
MEMKQPTAEVPIRSYFAGLLGGALLAFALVVGGLGLLVWMDRLPAPPITKVEFLDEKLRFLREHQDLDPTFVVVGSSMALRQFDGRPFASRLGQRHVLNGASTLINVHQTRSLALFYMEHLPKLQTVVLMLGAPDFENCTTTPADLFDPEDASNYAFKQDIAAPLYLRYFAPVLYLRRARNIQERRVPLEGEFWMDEYGSSPLQLTPEMIKGLRYGALTFDRSCVNHLLQLLTEIKAKGIRPVVVFSPVHPDYQKEHPESIERLKEVGEKVKVELREGVDLFNLSESDFRRADFYDAVHLQWTAVQRFSERLADLVLPNKAAARASPGSRHSVTDADTASPKLSTPSQP